MRWAALLALCGCLGPRAQLRLEGGAALKGCLYAVRPYTPPYFQCLERAEAFCRGHGLERDCATDWLSVRTRPL